MRLTGGLILVCIFLSSLLLSTEVGASSWSWTNTQPTVYRNEIVEPFIRPYCPTYAANVPISDISSLQEICVFDGEDIRFGTSFLNGGQFRAMISYGNDSTFHRLNGVCLGTAGCVYAGPRDVLATRYDTGLGYNSVKVYDSVKTRIQRTYNTRGLAFQDAFDATQPQYDLKDSGGKPVRIGSIALSHNGDWLLFEIINNGLGLLNLSTGQVRRIDDQGVQYGIGMNPTEELAISDSGTEAALMGENSGFRIIHITPGCGDAIVPNLLPKFSVGTEACPSLKINKGLFTTNFFAAYHPVFDSGGGRLTFYSTSTVDWGRRIQLQASGYQGGAELDLLAMGDSFSSGEGETEDGQYLPGTDNPKEKCHTSQRSYPFLLTPLLGLGRVKSVACSGATISDVVGSDSDYSGQANRLRELDHSDRSLRQTEARSSFQPGVIHQATFVRDNEPKVVTIGIGGNDAGLMGKLKTCAMPGTCEWAASPDALYRAGREIYALYDRLAAAYQSLLNTSPFTKLFAVGYPDIIRFDGECDPVTGILFDENERRFMSEGLQYLNQVIRAAARRAGITYLDIESSLEGHRLCDGSSDLAVNGLRIGDDTSPISALPFLKVIGNETFHPTPLGHRLIADRIFDWYGDLLSLDCGDLCGGGAIPQPPADWRLGASDIIQRAGEFLADDHFTNESKQLVVRLPSKTFIPSSNVSVRINNDDHTIATIQAGADGELDGQVTLPDGLVEGYHTVHLVGQSYDDVPVDVYQTISYVESQPEPPIVHDPIVNPPSSPESEESISEDRPIVAISRADSQPPVQQENSQRITIQGFAVLGATDTKPLNLTAATALNIRERNVLTADSYLWLLFLVGACLIVGIMAIWRVLEKL